MSKDKRPLQGPKKEVIAAVDAPIMNADKTQESDTATLDTGMKIGDAIAKAAFWWDTKGRAMIQDKNFASDNPGFGSFNANPQTNEDALNWFPSGIMAGKVWVELTKNEKLQVTKHWHHHNVRVPNIDPEMYLRAKKRPGICFYCDDEATAEEVLSNFEVREMCWPHFMERYPDEAEAAFNAQLGIPANDR